MKRTAVLAGRSKGLAAMAAVFAGLVLAGCASSSARLNKISPGMTRDEIVAAMGRPHSVAAHGDVEYLNYNLLNKGVGDMKQYTVKVIEGRVQSFGERSDFGPNLFETNAPAIK